MPKSPSFHCIFSQGLVDWLLSAGDSFKVLGFLAAAVNRTGSLDSFSSEQAELKKTHF